MILMFKDWLLLCSMYIYFVQPHSPDNRALARECKDVKIDRVYIGSCTGGKTEDFMAAAKVFLASVRPEISQSLIYIFSPSSVVLFLFVPKIKSFFLVFFFGVRIIVYVSMFCIYLDIQQCV